MIINLKIILNFYSVIFALSCNTFNEVCHIKGKGITDIEKKKYETQKNAMYNEFELNKKNKIVYKIREEKFGEVYQWPFEQIHKKYFVKQSCIGSDKKIDREKFIANEISFIREYRHEPYLKLADNDDFCAAQNNCALMSLIKYKGSLTDYLDGKIKLNKLYDKSLAWQTFALYQLAIMLDRLDKLGILHTNINPHNILMKSEFEFVFGDFSTMEKLEKKNGKNGDCITKLEIATEQSYKAPESYKGEYCRQSDVFSMALTFFYILVDKNIYQTYNNNKKTANLCPEANKITIENSLYFYCKHFDGLFVSMTKEGYKDRFRASNVLGYLKTQIPNINVTLKTMQEKYLKEYEDKSKLQSKSKDRQLDKLTELKAKSFDFDLKSVLSSFYNSIKLKLLVKDIDAFQRLKDNEVLFKLFDNDKDKILGMSFDDYIKKIEKDFELKKLQGVKSQIRVLV